MAKVIWANEAFDDLLRIEEFLGGVEKADFIISGLVARTRQLEQFPRSGAIQPTASESDTGISFTNRTKSFTGTSKTPSLSVLFSILAKTPAS